MRSTLPGPTWHSLEYGKCNVTKPTAGDVPRPSPAVTPRGRMDLGVVSSNSVTGNDADGNPTGVKAQFDLDSVQVQGRGGVHGWVGARTCVRARRLPSPPGPGHMMVGQCACFGQRDWG